MDVSECLSDFSGLIPISADPSIRVTRPELIAQRDGFRLHKDALSGLGKAPVGIQPPQIAMILAHLGDMRGDTTGSASAARPPAPRPRRYPHPERRVPSSAWSSESGRFRSGRGAWRRRSSPGKYCGAMVIVLQHADQPVQGRTGDKDGPDPIVELAAGQFVRIRSVRLDGADLLARTICSLSGVGIRQQESLARIHPRFRGLHVAIECLRGFGLQLLGAEPGRETTGKPQGQFSYKNVRLIIAPDARIEKEYFQV